MIWPFNILTTYLASSTPAIKADDLNKMQKATAWQANILMPYGDGTDGSTSLSAGVHQLADEGHYTDCTVPSGATLRNNGWPIFCQTSFVLSSGGTLSGSPTSGSGSSGGGVTDSVGPHSSFVRADINGNAHFGGPSASVGFSAYGSHYGFGGAGGNGGNGSVGTAATAAKIITPPRSYKRYPWLYVASNGGFPRNTFSPNDTSFRLLAYSSLLDSLRGGSSGSPGSGDGSLSGGGAGPAGSLVVVIAPIITINGALDSNGGAGGSPTGGNTGGGGGGGGGAFLFICQTLNYSPSGVTASAGAGAAGFGTGTSGSNGTAGNTTPFQIILPAT